MQPRGLLASARHTTILTAIFVTIAVIGRLSLAAGSSEPSGEVGPRFYFAMIAALLGLLFYMRAGLRRCGNDLSDLLAARPVTAGSLATDVLLGLLLLAAIFGTGQLFDWFMSGGDTAIVEQMVVHNAAQIPLWLALSGVAGLVEEFVFRGYFQRQFGLLLRNRWLGVAAQALLFGLSHGYQGEQLVIRITIYGLLFGLVTQLRRSLVPGIIAHVLTDVIGGLSSFAD